MKKLFSFKSLEVSLIKGFIFGIGISDSSSNLVVFIGPIIIDITLPKKETKSPYEIKL